MLPFGLLAGVSANALSAGLDLAGVTAPQGGPTGFTAALASFEQAGAKRAAPDAEGGPDGAPLFLEGEAPHSGELPGELAGLMAPAEPVQLPVAGDILVGSGQAGLGTAGPDTNAQEADRGTLLPDPALKAGPSPSGNLTPGSGGETGNNGAGLAGAAQKPQTAGSPVPPQQAAAAAPPTQPALAGADSAASGPATVNAAPGTPVNAAAPDASGIAKPVADPGSVAVELTRSPGSEVQALARSQVEQRAGEPGPLKSEPAAAVPAENARQRRWQTELPEVARAKMVRPAGGESTATPSSTATPPALAAGSGETTAAAVPAGVANAKPAGPADAGLAAAGNVASTGDAPAPVKMAAAAAGPEMPAADGATLADEPLVVSNRPAIPGQEALTRPGGLNSQQSGPSGQGATNTPQIGVNAEAETRAGLAQAAKQGAGSGQPAPEVEADLPDDGVDPGEIPAGNLQRKANGTGPAPAGAGTINGAAKPAAAANAPGLEPVATAALDADLADGEDAVDADLPLTVTARAAGQGGEVSLSRSADALQNPTQAQSGQVATQVAAEVARNLRNGQTRFQMRFDPPELGRVDVNLKVGRDGSVQAHLIVERPETLDMFLRDQRGLERALEAAGLNADSENLKFSLNDNGSGESAFAQDDNAEGGDSYAGDGGAETEGDPVVQETLQLSLQAQRGGLDIRI